ncbi:MAG: DUF3987 domain-containing protein, partial [Bacteroidales bacterium]|nr:DUF3987 domain-containing protein [Bacteroidales bacterium]
GMDQYKTHGGNDRQHYIMLFDAMSWKIDRAKGSQFIPNTGASILGGIQPMVLPSIMGQTSFEDGLFPRFLLECPDIRKTTFNKKGIDPKHLQFWEKLVLQCTKIPLEMNEGFCKPKILVFDEVTSVMFVTFINEILEDSKFLSERAKVFIPKLITYFFKFTGILHIINEMCRYGELKSTIISSDTVSSAIYLTRYYMGQVSKVLKLYGNSRVNISEDLKVLIQVLYDLKISVKGGRLYLSEIRNKYNNVVPNALRIPSDNKTLSHMLQKIGLETGRGTGGFACLTWEPEKMKKIFSKYNITKITDVTASS